jgi:hypothetical protein
MPGMTANANIFVQEAKGLLIVDSKALTPDSTLMKDYIKKYPQKADSGITQKLNNRGKGRGRGQGQGQGNSVDIKKPATLWVKKGTEIEPVKVFTGLTDGTNTEIKSGVPEGTEVIVSMQLISPNDTTKKATVKSPFTPSRPGRGNR